VNAKTVMTALREAEERLNLVLDAVAFERENQERLHGAGKLPGAHCSDPKVSNASKLAVLVEEIGEVAKQINEGTLPAASRAHLRKELIQTAAVAVAWAESLTPGPEVSGQRSEVRRSA
jgi:hypothetical protein